jgi:hypothetical protein
MKLFLFLDDWMIDYRRDIEREWVVAKPADVEPDTSVNSHMSVWWDPERQKYGCYYMSYEGKMPEKSENMWQEPDIYRISYMAESDDGYTFRPWNHGGRTCYNVPDRKHSIYFPRREGSASPLKTEAPSGIMYDPFAKDPAERFLAGISTGELGTSPNGYEWTAHPDRRWNEPFASDDVNDLLYNPVTGKYMVFCRPRNLDRRIAIAESDDLKTFSELRVVIQPDVLDPPLLEFYGITPIWYEDLFIGALWDYRVPQEEDVSVLNLDRVVKMEGPLDNSFCYSYDGRHWLRGPRTPMFPRAEPGEYGCYGHYCTAIVPGPDNVLRFYNQSIRVEHGDIDNQKKFWAAGEGDSAMRIYTLRKDGFCSLNSIGVGHLRTRGLIPKDGNLRINYQAPLGWIKVQLSKSNGEPHEGFTFEESIPLAGDEVEATPQWKSGKSLDELVGQWLKIEFQMFGAKLYAYRWDCTLHYAHSPQERI